MFGAQRETENIWNFNQIRLVSSKLLSEMIKRKCFRFLLWVPLFLSFVLQLVC